MFRTSLAAAAVLGSAALTATALSSAPATAAPAAVDAPSVVSSHAVTVKGAKGPTTSFAMVRAAGVVKAGCLPKARAKVTITSTGEVEVMKVHASGLPKRTDFDFFVITVPDAPFGLSWYQGDLESNKKGKADATFIGRFNEETFSVAPNVAPAPVRHSSPIADAKVSPKTAPVHQYHLGFWFNSPEDAAKAGCGGVVTPFNGEHNAGTQAMSTRNFPVGNGPLGQIAS